MQASSSVNESKPISKPIHKLRTIMNSLSEIDLNSPVFPADSFRWTLPELLKSNKDGLNHVPVEVLAKCVRPVLEGLRSIDAESLLELERTPKGAVLDRG